MTLVVPNLAVRTMYVCAYVRTTQSVYKERLLANQLFHLSWAGLGWAMYVLLCRYSGVMQPEQVQPVLLQQREELGEGVCYPPTYTARSVASLATLRM